MLRVTEQGDRSDFKIPDSQGSAHPAASGPRHENILNLVGAGFLKVPVTLQCTLGKEA